MSIYQNIPFIESYDPGVRSSSFPETRSANRTTAISSASIRKRAQNSALRLWKCRGREASRFGLMVADENDKITEFQEKPKQPKSNLASMGIYIFNWDILKKYLIEDEADPNSSNDFGNNIIPNSLKTDAICTLITSADTGKM